MSNTIGGGASIVQGVGATGPTNRTSRAAARTDQPDPSLSLLTPSDRELIFQATGQRVDGTSVVAPLFAFVLAGARKDGGFAGEDVDASYLEAMRTSYRGTPEGRHWVPTLDRALAYLRTNTPGSGHVDLRG